MKTYEQRTEDISARIACRVKRKRAITVSCVSAVVLVLALVLFVPYNTQAPDVSAYADSPYYSLIQRINEATYVPPAYKNNYEALSDSIKDAAEMNGSSDIALDAESSINSSADYVEVTDNQVAGVIESDIIKRSTEYIYYLRGAELSVYSIAGADSQLVDSYTVMEREEKTEEVYTYYDNAEMYLSQDCTTVTILIDGYHSQIGSCTIVLNLDVTDPGNITETGRIYITGSYLSSRLVDGDLLLMSKFKVRADKDFSDESTFLPQAGTPGNMKSVAAEDIFAPEELSSTQYTVICKLDGSTLEEMDSVAFLSYSDEIYVSEENIFATRSFIQSDEDYYSRTMTQITAVRFAGETMEPLGSIAVEGSVKDQYSMDEYAGILRVVTSVSNMIQDETEFDTVFVSQNRSASLYCISLEDFSIAASVEHFAPEGEQAESVRFDGDYAYVCTAVVVELTDPVFFFDLRDLDDITYKDTGTIDGYSSSLVELGEGYLLGIGYGSAGQLKIEIYEETDEGVASVCAYELDADFSEDYKSYFIDREKNLIGLGVYDWGSGRGKSYVLLHFDGYKLREVGSWQMEGNLNTMRSVLIDGWLYLFGNDFLVVEVW